MADKLKEQYDKILRFCFYRVHNADIAEDLTQETFLRFLERPNYRSKGIDLRLLYTIAGNLCTDYFRRKQTAELTDDIPDSRDQEEEILTNTMLASAMKTLPSEDCEIILLRYVNEVPVKVLCSLYGVSRATMARRIRKILDSLRKNIVGEEADYGTQLQKSYR